ncbi:MAG: hypothetical protein HYR73_04605 [Candidatus Eisenbacteria bacterium]|nr:hypothetical protein [Candidatus Eisenbacteria bacterium]
MHRRPALPAPASLSYLLAGLMLLAMMSIAPSARAISVDDEQMNDPAARTHAIKQVQRDLLLQGAHNHITQVRAEQGWRRWVKKHPNVGPHGARVRRAPETEENAVPLDDRTGAASRAPRASATSAFAIPTNVRCNNPSIDASNAGQSEEMIASLGNYVMVAWNDGQGFNNGNDIQNYAYSTDGGATFIQPSLVSLGIPRPAGATGFKWSSDPVMTLNEKTGEFFYCGLCDSAGGAFSGVGIVKATFPGGATPPVWGTPHIARMVDASMLFVDKQWLAADSSSGNLYLSYTLFTVSEDSIEFRRSTDGGSTWGPIVIMSADSAAGYVQGSRPAVGPNGELYVTWEQIGITTPFDHFRIRKSTDQGGSFGPDLNVDDHYANFGTGAPGFNRQSGITFPSIVVDRTFGPNRGRVYVGWNEAVNWYDDPLGGGGSKSEVESNNTSGTANAFTIGQKVRGGIGNTTDLDWFSFSATQGTTYIFWCDSLSFTLAYTMRIFCSNGLTRLQLGGADVNTAGSQGFLVWTAPTTATYYFRMAYNGGTGLYRVETGVDAPSAGERSRDHRDVFVAHSDNGTTWSTPTRANDDLPRLDDWLPEVAIGADGMPYVMWFDWRDAASNCNGSSQIYLSRSSDGGATWAANQRITTAATASDWTNVASNIAPNQGDYSSMYGDSRFVHPSWADGREGNPNVWSTTIDTGHDMLTCSGDTTVTTGTSLPLTFSFANRNQVFSNDFVATLVDDDGWTSGAPQPVTVAANASASLVYSVPVPSPSAPANNFTLTVTNAKGTRSVKCQLHVTVAGNVSVTPQSWVFGLRQSSPNPAISSARIDYTLPREGEVKLVIFGLHGERVRTLVSGVRGAGSNFAIWDGRDDRGHGVAAGAYFYRLEAQGQSATRRLVFLP